MLNVLEGFWHFFLLAIGFSLVIFIHELGHFLTAKMVGIKVTRFAIGFGPAAFSFRKGLGLRFGSSEDEYRRRAVEHLNRLRTVTSAVREGAGEYNEYQISKAGDELGISETEYRFNWIPLGGYVLMLGQDDLDPGHAAVADPRSFSSKSIGARMVVISAGVIMNLILAIVLFVAVYMHGIDADAPRIGSVYADGPAAAVKAVNADALGVQEPGLQPGDLILSVNGKPAKAFKDLLIATAMAKRNDSVRLDVQRPGVDKPLIFEIMPREDKVTELLDLGVYSASTNRINPAIWDDPRLVERVLKPRGLDKLRPGMRLVELVGKPVRGFSDVSETEKHLAGGEPVKSVWKDEQGTIEVDLKPLAIMQSDMVKINDRDMVSVRHLLGLTPLMGVAAVNKQGAASGLKAGDIITRLGDRVFPNYAEGIKTIRKARGSHLNVTVLRDGDYVDLNALVSSKGLIGFTPDELFDKTNLSSPLKTVQRGDEDVTLPAANINFLPGSELLAVNGRTVADFTDIRSELRLATSKALAENRSETVTLSLVPFAAENNKDRETVVIPWKLDPQALKQLHELGWQLNLPTELFEPELVQIKADGPVQAISMGLQETWEMLVMTYLTIDRVLVQRTVKVQHIKGPVGIAELGTRFAGQGFFPLLLFLAMISVNLAVINFLPIPIVDGGVFVFLLIEKIKGSPVSPVVQNAATMIGLLLIGTVVLVTFYNDVANLLH
ncbi:MAG TPA: hypothetical protein ENJ06_06700 [Phycisphaeraceae bacterium]|nr:hypothetical protein [Phycisphaeraceae bacterium]